MIAVQVQLQIYPNNPSFLAENTLHLFTQDPGTLSLSTSLFKLKLGNMDMPMKFYKFHVQ